MGGSVVEGREEGGISEVVDMEEGDGEQCQEQACVQSPLCLGRQ